MAQPCLWLKSIQSVGVILLVAHDVVDTVDLGEKLGGGMFELSSGWQIASGHEVRLLLAAAEIIKVVQSRRRSRKQTALVGAAGGVYLREKGRPASAAIVT